MRRWLGWLAIAWLLIVCAVALLAYGGTTAHASLYDRTQSLAAQLRCPVCEGQSVADSQSDIARGIRGLIQRDLARGESEGQIKAFLLARYSNISLAPSTSGIGTVAWLAPPLLVLGGLGLVLTLVVDWRTRGRRAGSRPPNVTPTSAIYVERVRAELAADEAGTRD